MAKHILTINGGSSSIKFGLFDDGQPPERLLAGKIDRIGLANAELSVSGSDKPRESRQVHAPTQTAATTELMNWLEQRAGLNALAAVGHRIVHGGPHYSAPELVRPELLEELRRISPYDPEHMPAEIELIEAFGRHHPHLPQIACFDTAFHGSLPRVASLLAIPRRYHAMGVRRYGFHGLSYSFLMEELARVAGARAARGRVILAHLGNGASLAAVRDGHSIDTTMAFTPTAGLPMSTRSGDIDPGLVWYLARTEHMSAEQFHDMVNRHSGLLGISGLTNDMRVLQAICLPAAPAIFAPPTRSTSSATRRRNGSAASRPGSAASIHSSLAAGSAKTLRRCAPASVMGWTFWASISTRIATTVVRPSSQVKAARLPFMSCAPMKRS